ncbi:hypothetical protein EL17_09470 [Anditalea andensis]|uniref:Thiamine biosynthesis protein ThiS n=2 Tax=Anditalea andensis TaxID=1048983 RepID=A0A074KUT6_9BACT|nr:hypothetical protein EL17_09470 [Anditalea andensis]
MEVIINDQRKNFPDHHQISAEELVSLTYPQSQKGIALAIGDKVIPKELWKATLIQPEDQLLIFRATQGG